MDDDDDFDLFGAIDGIVEQYKQNKGNNKQNGSPQNAGGVQQNPGASAPNATWQQPNYGSQPPPGFVEQSHHAAYPPSFGQQQGPAWQQPPRPGNPARPEPTKQGAWQQNGYTSAPRNVFGNAMPAAQPLPLNMHSPVRGAAPAPTSTPPTNSLLAAQLAGPEALPELNLGVTLERLQREKDELQRRLNDNEGQNALLRSRVERAERERREMQTRVSQTSQGGLAAATSADLQRQLDIARQQLAFKEQEAAEVLRRNQDWDERLKAADAKAAALAAEAKRLEQQRAQLEAELAEAHRDRRERAADASTSGNEPLRSPGAARRSLSPRNWQQQQQPPSASGRKSDAAVVAGAAGSAAAAGGRSTASAGMKRRLSGATAAAPNPGSQIGERSGIARSSQPPSGVAAENVPAEPAHECARWHPAAAPPGDGSLWQRLSAACGASLAALLEERGQREATGGISKSSGPCGQLGGVAQQARQLAWGVDSSGPALLCALCSSLAASALKGSGQGNEGDVRWHCAMLDVLSALLRLCGSCRAIAVASLAAAGHAPAAQPTQASGVGLRVQLHGQGRSAGVPDLVAAYLNPPEALGIEAMRLTDAASVPEDVAFHLSHLRGLRLGEPEKVGRGVLNLLLSLLLSWKETGAGFACALRSVAVLVGCAPAADRGAMSPVLTSGVLEKAACHQAAFLQILHLLLECTAICDLLEARLAAQAASGEGDSVAQPAGATASDGVPAPAGDGTAGETSWSGCWTIFRALNVFLTALPHTTAAASDPNTTSPRDCPYKVPRRALLVLALCMEAGRFGLLLPLLSEEAGSPSLVQRLVILVDEATQNPEGGSLRALAAPKQATTASEALRWQQALRLAQEALTLLRGLSVQELLQELVLEEHLAMPASTRLCHTVVGRVVQLRPLPAGLLRAAPPLPLAPWAHAVGASSVTRSVCVSAEASTGTPGCLPVATVEDVVHLAKGLLRRVQERLPVLMQP
ncbi:hypothetical protein WJX75_000979 [Coccomyxa subellipsoidea]|uniref:Uncharacterized protein n=1 Tax=Coccomyxa subellipsoidea TaxID=248742 RepID=A0ABR2YBV4_9CHLO